MNTFSILGEYNALLAMMEEVDENGEFINDDATLKALLDELNQSKSDKLDNIELIKRDFQSKADTLKAEMDRLAKRKKSFESQVDKLQSLQELLLNEDGFKTDRFTFSYRKSESVKVPDVCDNSYPKEWIVTKYQFDKKAIKEAIKKSGIDYSEYGIELVTNVSLQVR